MGKVECNGYPDACINAKFNLLSGQRGFKCIGSQCPPDAPKPFEILYVFYYYIIYNLYSD